MFTVEQEYSRYRLSLAGLRRYYAGTIEEAAAAMLHYYARPHDEAHCPLCAAMAKEKKGKA